MSPEPVGEDEAAKALEARDELRQLRLAELRKRVAAGLDSLDRGADLDGEAAFDELDAGLADP